MDRLRGFLVAGGAMAEVGLLPLPALLCESPERCSLATEAVSANIHLPSRSCWPFSA